jgi:hypothetical protein
MRESWPPITTPRKFAGAVVALLTGALILLLNHVGVLIPSPGPILLLCVVGGGFVGGVTGGLLTAVIVCLINIRFFNDGGSWHMSHLSFMRYLVFLLVAPTMGFIVGRVRQRAAVLADVVAQRERSRAQSELAKTNERFNLAVRAASIGIWEWELSTDLSYCSREHEMLFALDPGRGVRPRGDFAQRIHPEDIQHVADTIQNVIKASDGYSGYAVEYRIVLPDGVTRWISSTGKVVRDAAGSANRIIGVTLDVSDRHRADQERLKLLASEREARAAAEAANRAKDRFLAVLSHELRTPLTPVLAAVQDLQMERDPATAPQIEMIRRNVELEARLIDDLLDLTRISKGKLLLNRETVDVHALVHHVIDMCASDIASGELHVTAELNAAQHHVQADPARLQQVLWNLLKNSIKFTPAGGTIAITSANDASHNGHPGLLSISVKDTGIGMERDQLSRIFIPFEQAEESIIRRFGGLGLGLAISKSLIELHGGQLQADSDGPGKGASFTVQMPYVAPKIGEAPAEPLPRVAQEPKRMRILMVDDHVDTNQALQRLLTRRGYQVRTAGSVAAALKAAEEPFDLLISDIGLPDGSGIDLLRMLRDRQPPVKAIALSGFGMEDDIRRSREAGFSEHLVKPINLQKLEEAIQNVAADEPL